MASMKKKFGLVVIEAPMLVSIFIRIIGVGLAYYFGDKLLLAYELQEVTRRGQVFTLAESPTTFYIRVALYTVFALVGIWSATSGTEVRTKLNDQLEKQ
jgi:hypothetical protein